MDAGHLFYLLMESARDNALFRSPVAHPRHVLDIGTGTGTWAIDVADKFPDTTVYGVDLYPPPNAWVPPNCYLQVEDVLREWTWHHKFDLIHLRLLLGAFTPDEWDDLYRTIYENLEPGGWIEQVELDVRIFSDDATLPKDSSLASWGPTFLGCGARSGRPLDTQETMKDRILAAGFVNVQEDLFKCPLGPWPKGNRIKEAGKVNWQHWNAGFEGWAMWLLTKHGAPRPWNADQVRVYVAGVRQEFKKKGQHIYHLS
jgi:SAM-dependent methyltransferase